MGEIMENLTLTAALAKALGGGGGGGSGGVEDVLLNGQSIVNAQGKAVIPVASGSTLGTVKINNLSSKLFFPNPGEMDVKTANASTAKAGTAALSCVTTQLQQYATFYGLAKAAGADEKDSPFNMGTYTETAKSAISQMLSAPETVSGSTPSIVAKPGVQYICGGVSTIDITVPASGIIDVIFESGSTPAVLTVTPPTGKTMKWANGFDPTSLEANTVYKINIVVAGSYCLGTATSWA